MSKADQACSDSALGRITIPTEADVFDMSRIMPVLLSDANDPQGFLSISLALSNYRTAAEPLKITKQVNAYLKSLDIRCSDYLQKAAIISTWTGRPFSGTELRSAVARAVDSGRDAVFAHLLADEPILGAPFRSLDKAFATFQGEPEPSISDYSTLLRWALREAGVPLSRAMINSTEEFIKEGMSVNISAAQRPLASERYHRYYQGCGQEHPGQSVPLFFGMSVSSDQAQITNRRNLQFEHAAKVIIAFRTMLSWQRAGSLAANLQDERPDLLASQLNRQIKETLDLDRIVLSGIANRVLARDAGVKVEFEFDFASWLNDLP